MKSTSTLFLALLLSVGQLFSANDEYFGLVETSSPSYIIEAGTQSRIYTGGWGSGFKISTDEAASFSSPSSGDPGLFITDISVQEDEVWVSSLDKGVSYSSNHGQTFVSINGDLPEDVEVNTVVENKGRIIIGTRGHGFFYSDNGGDNWTQEVGELRYWDIKDVEVFQGDSVVAGTYGGGFYRSVDNGSTWVEANAVSNGLASKYINDLYRDFSSSGYAVYAAVNDEGIYYTDNGGFLWTKIDTTGLILKKNHASGVAVTEINAVRQPLASFKDNGIWYYDPWFAQKWVTKTRMDEGFHDVTVAENGYVYAITANNGIYKSTDNGEYWIPQNRDEHRQNVQIEPSSNGDYYYFDQKRNILKFFENYGSSIEDITLPSMGNFESPLQVEFHKGDLYFFSNYSLYKKNSTGWDQLFTHTNLLGDGDSVKFIVKYTITPNDKVVGIYSTVFGDPMTMAPPGPDQRQYIFDYNLITNEMDNDQYRFMDQSWASSAWAEITSDKSSNVMIVSMDKGHMVRVNGTTTWTQTLNPEFNANKAITYRTYDFDWAFNKYFISTNQGLFYSSDNGKTWTQEYFDFPEYDPSIKQYNTPVINQFEALSATSWIVAMDRHWGLYYTSNGGQSWELRNESVVVADGQVLIQSEDNDLYYFNNYLYLRPYPANLEAPNAVTPENGAVAIEIDKTIDIEWTETVSPLYELQISRNEQFTQLNEEFVLAPNQIVADVPGLEYNRTYYWRVRSKYYGSYSVFNTYSFTTELAPPVLISPKDSVIGIAVDEELLWEETDGADSYVVEIATDSMFTSIVKSYPNVTDLSVAADGLDNYTEYYWRAKAENEQGNFSDWSAWGRFSTILSAPMLTAPADASAKVAVNSIFTWEEVPGAESYEFLISKDSGFPETETDTVSDIMENETEIEGLEYQTTYYWKVYAFDQESNSSLASETWEFTTGLPAVTLVSPANNSINTTYDLPLVWSTLSIGAESADEYDFELSANPDMSNPIVTEYGTTDLTYDVTNLEDYTNYYWRVRGNFNGEEGTWSPIWSFRTKMLPMLLLTPADEEELTGTKTKLTWEPPKGPVLYDLLVYEGEGESDTLYYRTELTTLEFDLIGLDSSETYCWQVRGYNQDRSSSTGWSDKWCFTTATVSVREHNPNLTYGPNPTKDMVSFNGNGKGYTAYTLMSSTGETVLYKELGLREEFTIDLTQVYAGSYFLMLETPTGYELVPIRVE